MEKSEQPKRKPQPITAEALTKKLAKQADTGVLKDKLFGVCCDLYSAGIKKEEILYLIEFSFFLNKLEEQLTKIEEKVAVLARNIEQERREQRG